MIDVQRWLRSEWEYRPAVARTLPRAIPRVFPPALVEIGHFRRHDSRVLHRRTIEPWPGSERLRAPEGDFPREIVDERPGAAPRPDGAKVAHRGAMSFAAVIDRVRAEFTEMPGLELTLPQAVRLWTLGADDCRHVIDALVDAGFLKWTARRTIVRTGLDLAIGPDASTANIRVRRRR